MNLLTRNYMQSRYTELACNTVSANVLILVSPNTSHYALQRHGLHLYLYKKTKRRFAYPNKDFCKNTVQGVCKMKWLPH